MPGRLLVIATPIGNLSDASPRMVAAMRDCARIYCEDTRQTRKLLRHFAIDAPLESLHEHNEQAKLDAVLARLEAGETVGLVSDAGTPLLSDPGFPLVREARRRGIAVEPVPGPFAAATALSVAGIAPVPFLFAGFPPHRRGERQRFYRELAAHRVTTIVYESPQRAVESLEDARDAFGEVEATVARELTKIHEEILHGTLGELVANLAAREQIRGEITIVLAAAAEEARDLPPPDVLRRELDALRASGMRRNDAIKALGEKHGVGKNELYRLLIE